MTQQQGSDVPRQGGGVRGRRPRSGPARPPGPAGGAPAGPAGRGPRRGARDRGEDGALLDLARQFAAAYLEVEVGRRDPRQLVAAGWARPAALPAFTPGTAAPGHVASLAGTRTSPGRFDAVAVVRRGRRAGAIAIRIGLHRGRWMVDDATRPEDAGR